jgi:predicted negative regulator of RcsB-dependent stress response
MKPRRKITLAAVVLLAIAGVVGFFYWTGDHAGRAAYIT